MQRTKIILIVGLVIPILSLAAIVLNNVYEIRTGKEIVLPIIGYDPRDLLAGHYLNYRIEYGVPDICANNINNQMKNNDAYVCLEPKQFSFTVPEDCELMIKGVCSYTNFDAGVQRFYASEANAKLLEKDLLKGNASVALAVTESGKAYVKYLLVGGKQWHPK